jgi:lipopolysaccharide export system ATP-binding protein
MAIVYDQPAGTSRNGNKPEIPAVCLAADGVRKTYGGRRVVDDVSVFVSHGEIVGLLGANGAGKTTTFYMMVGLETTEAGTSIWTGKTSRICRCICGPGSALATCRRNPRSFASSQRNKTYSRSWKPRISAAQIDSHDWKSCSMSLAFHMFEKYAAMRFPAANGAGSRFARCLATEPRFILLDEPFAGIDPLAIDDLREIILYLKKTRV